MYAKAKIPHYTHRDEPKIERLDRLDMLIFAALFVEKFAPDPNGKTFLPRSILTADIVEHRAFRSGRHDGAPNGWKTWEFIHALRPFGYVNWYRPDLDQWVADYMVGYRSQPVHAVAPCHREYVRHAA